MTWFNEKSKLIKKIKLINKSPLFSFIEFNLSDFCNRKCTFCPQKSLERNEMSVDTFITVMKQLQEIKYNGLIGFSGYCEPTIYSNLENAIILTKDYLPKSKLVINSNGDFLDNNKIKNLMSIGVDYIVISAYEKTVYDKFDKIKNLYINKRFDGDMIITNRGGALGPLKISNDQVCYMPFYMLYIDWNGDILFCYNNFLKKNVLGNIKKDSLLSIWYGDELNSIRQNLSKSDRQSIDACKNCDALGNVMGKKSYSLWKKYKDLK